MDPQIQYCRSEDGTRLAYATVGSGATLLRISAWFLNLQDTSRHAPMSAYLRGFLPYRRLVTFDRRGVGASQREVTDLSLEAQVQDALAVANQSGADSFDVLGEVDGAYVALAVAARCPERVNRVVAYAPPRAPASYYIRSAKSIRDDWSAGRRLLAAEMFPDGPVESQRWARESLKDGVEPTVAARYMEAIAGFDPGVPVAQVRAPTFVFGRSSRMPGYVDPRDLAAAIPNARYAALAQETDIRPFLRAMSQFLTGRDAEAETSLEQAATRASGTAVVLFTDIVSSTALTERMGDAAFRDASRALDAALRTAIRDAGGAAIDRSLGDGVLATFPTAAQAIDAARRCRALTASSDIQPPPSDLQIRIGVHAGDVIREDNNVFGGTVNIASRICGMSAPGEILVSDVVRGMARSSAGVEFEDRGEQEMKGVGEPVRVYAVRGTA